MPMHNDTWNILGAVLVILSVFYLGSWAFTASPKSREGMTSNASTTTAYTSSQKGEGASAASFGAAIKATTTNIQDALLVNKYRTDYETTLLNMDEYLGTLLLRQALSMDPDSETIGDSIRALGDISTAKTALNVAMQTLNDL